MSSLVSIVVPVYNLEEHIEKCIDVLLNQTYPDLEIIMVDDGSRDKSLQILKTFESIKVISQKNQGAAAARNNGIRNANGKYIAFIDGDDWIEKDFVELMVKKIEEDDADLVVCDYLAEPYDESETELIKLNLEENRIYSLKKNPEILNNIANAPWNKLYRLDLIKEENIVFPEGHRHHDMAFTQHYLLVADKIVYLNRALNHYLKDRPNNISTSYDKKIRDSLIMVDYVVKKYREYDMFETAYSELEYLVIANMIVSLRKIVNLTDSSFVFRYVDEVFEWLHNNFNSYQGNYYFEKCSKSDKIYRKSWTTKLYYRYARLKKIGR